MRALLIAPDQPWPLARHGAAQRTELLRRSLAALCPTDLAVACIGADETAPAADHIVAVFREPASPAPAPRGLAERLYPLPQLKRGIDAHYRSKPELRDWCRAQIDSGRYGFVVVRYLRTAALTGLLETAPAIPVFVDCDDVDWLKEAGRIAGLALPLRWRFALARANRHRERLCRGLAGRARHLWAASPAEQAALRPMPCTVLPNIPFTLPERVSPPRAEARPTVLFVGLLNYAPNREGVDRFIARSWPRVLARHPQARLRIVGKGLDADTAERWRRSPGVELAGYVDDLDREYADSHCTICPVHWGGGSNIKVRIDRPPACERRLEPGRPAVGPLDAARPRRRRGRRRQGLRRRGRCAARRRAGGRRRRPARPGRAAAEAVVRGLLGDRAGRHRGRAGCSRAGDRMSLPRRPKGPSTAVRSKEPA